MIPKLNSSAKQALMISQFLWVRNLGMAKLGVSASRCPDLDAVNLSLTGLPLSQGEIEGIHFQAPSRDAAGLRSPPSSSLTRASPQDYLPM